jgi:predicted esterase
VRNSLDVGVLDDWRDDWDQIDSWIFEFAIGDGEWWQDEIGDGVMMSGWIGEFEAVDDDTVVIHDQECDITYDIALTAETLAVDVAESDCPADDTALQTAMVEAAPFNLVQEAGWAVAPATPPPGAGVSLAPLTPLPSTTSGDRQVARPIGTVEGAAQGYLEYLPLTYDEAGDPSPLLVFLHGSGESGTGRQIALESTLARAGIPVLIAVDRWPDERPFVVLSPQHEEVSPNWCMESDEIKAFLDFALEHYNVDPARVYVTGLSCGAIGLWNYLAEYGGKQIAAAIPIAGFGLAAVDRQGCELATLPIWAFHGELDDRVPAHGAAYPLTELQGCTDPAPTDARLTVFPRGAHDVWTRVYSGSSGDDIYEWLLSHHR